MVDLDMVLDELWSVTREEMNFLTEAANMEEFAKLNGDIAYVGTAKLYQEYTTAHVLVMELLMDSALTKKINWNRRLRFSRGRCQAGRQLCQTGY